MAKVPVITESEWMAELDKFREPALFSGYTDEQWTFIKYGRSDKGGVVPWRALQLQFEKIFGNTGVGIATFKDRASIENRRRGDMMFK